MGGCVTATAVKAVSKKGYEEISSTAESIHDIPVTTLDGNQVSNLGELTRGKKCTMIVNVASK